MIGAPTDVIDRYQRMAVDGEDGYHLGRDAGQKSVSCSHISFAAADQDEPVRTGYPMFARLGFRASEVLENVGFSILIYWPSGYLCAQLTTALTDPRLRIEPRSGEVGACWPGLEIQPAWDCVHMSSASK